MTHLDDKTVTVNLADLDIRVVALSVDDEATTRQTIEHGLEFPAEEQAA